MSPTGATWFENNLQSLVTDQGHYLGKVEFYDTNDNRIGLFQCNANEQISVNISDASNGNKVLTFITGGSNNTLGGITTEVVVGGVKFYSPGSWGSQLLIDTASNFITGFVGNYSRVRVSAYSRLRTSAYTGTYSRDRVSTYVGDFIGDYARNFAGNYTRSFEGNYARSFLGNYVGATISDSLTNVTETYTLYVRVA